ncbi:hypothetical protein [Falsirhodobacter xinxiangensis]|uniref:hypothetical protein n=1 Tax=Falsirhodobacter xinxiangensis TaxID=2530049 RepID=UPI0010A9A814|nr:hypothetical protein [Rhodobacter xinxiangensis]
MRLVLPILASLLLLVPLAGGLRHGAPAIWAELCDGHLIALDAQGKPIPDGCPDCTPSHAVAVAEGGAIPDRTVRIYPAQPVAAPSPEVVAKMSVIRARAPPMVRQPHRMISLKG